MIGRGSVFHPNVALWSDKKQDLLIIFSIFALYFIFYNDVFFFPKLIGGIDYQIPLSLHRQFSFGVWTELNLGYFPSDFSFYNLVFNGVVSVLSAGNQIIAQKIFFLGIPLTGIGAYLLIRNHITQNKPAAAIGSIFFMFAPFSIHNYGTGLIWEFAFMTWALNYGISFLSSRERRFRHLFLFNIFYSLSIAFGIHAILGIVLILAMIAFARIVTRSESFFPFIKRTTPLTLLGIIIFCVINPGIVTVFLAYLGITFSDVSGSHVIPPITVDEIYLNYQSDSPLNILTTANWLRLSYLPVGGLIILGIALFGLIKTPDKRSKFLIYGFAISLLFFASYGLMIYFKAWFFPFFLSVFSFLVLFRGTEGVAPFILLSTAVLLSYSLTIISNYIKGARLKNLNRLSAVLFTAILLILFAYTPAFSPLQHLKAQSYDEKRAPGPVAYPQVYQEIISWLRDRPDHNMYRTVLLPTSFLANLYVPLEYQSVLSPANGYSNTNLYVKELQESLIKGSTDWGRQLAPASVKYIVVPYVSDEPTLTEGTVQNEPRIWYGLNLMMNGDPASFIRLLEKQNDIQMIYNSSSFAVYENLEAIPRISSFTKPIVLLESATDLVEWSSQAANYGSIPLLFDSFEDVPLALRPSIYLRETNIAYDEIKIHEILSQENPSSVYAKVLQNDSLLRVMLPNIHFDEKEFLFNIIVDDKNKLTHGVVVPSRSVGILEANPSALGIRNGSTIFLADSILNQISNSIIWHSPSTNKSDDNTIKNFNLQQSTRLMTREGKPFQKDPLDISPVTTVKKYSSSEYVIHVNSTKPFYIFLGESYSANWGAYYGSESLSHYEAPFGNVFYIDKVGEFDLHIKYDNPQRIIILAGVISFSIFLFLAIFDKAVYHRIDYLLCKGRKHNNKSL